MSDAADKATLEKAAATFDELTGVLGLMYNRKAEEAPDEVKQLVEERAAAKKPRTLPAPMLCAPKSLSWAGM